MDALGVNAEIIGRGLKPSVAGILEDDSALCRGCDKGEIYFGPLSFRGILSCQEGAGGQLPGFLSIRIIPDLDRKTPRPRCFDLTVDANFDGNIIGFANDGVEFLVDAAVDCHFHAEIS